MVFSSVLLESASGQTKERNVHISLIQPRSPWGAHPYLPNGILSVAARCKTVGISSAIIDENLGDQLDGRDVRDQLRRSDIIGIGAIGSPYIPEALRIGQSLRKLGYTQPIAIGGEVIMRLSADQFSHIYGQLGDVRQVASDAALGDLLGISSLLKIGGLSSMYNTSMGPVINALTPRMRAAYFGKEWCLFTSQGCVYNCDFCAASKGRKEQFRSPDALADEVEALARAVKESVGARAPYEVYCSTLDGCQTPDEMERTLRTVAETCERVGTFLPLRFLATAKCTVRIQQKDPMRLTRWRAYGLACIGIGADGPGRGNTRVHKASREEEDQSFAAIKNAGIQPEATMVIGLPSDGQEAFRGGIRRMVELSFSGVRPRPLMGKQTVPGNEGWSKNGSDVRQMLDNPALFRELDFGGLASALTHPKPIQRWVSSAVFFCTTMALKAVSPTGCPTQPLMPTESTPRLLRALGRAWNRFMPQDR